MFFPMNIRRPVTVLDLLGDVMEQQEIEQKILSPKIKQIIDPDGSHEFIIRFNPNIIRHPQIDITTYDDALKFVISVSTDTSSMKEKYQLSIPRLDADNVSAQFVSDHKIVITCPVIPLESHDDDDDDDDDDDNDNQDVTPGTINIHHHTNK